MSKYWFRKRQGLWSKDHGWGWRPVTWQGWAVVVGFIFLILAAAFATGLFSENPPITQGVLFLAIVLGLLGVAAVISHRKTKR